MFPDNRKRKIISVAWWCIPGILHGYQRPENHDFEKNIGGMLRVKHACAFWTFLEGDSKSTQGSSLTLASKHTAREGSVLPCPFAGLMPHLFGLWRRPWMLYLSPWINHSLGTIRTTYKLKVRLVNPDSKWNLISHLVKPLLFYDYTVSLSQHMSHCCFKEQEIKREEKDIFLHWGHFKCTKFLSHIHCNDIF